MAEPVAGRGFHMGTAPRLPFVLGRFLVHSESLERRPSVLTPAATTEGSARRRGGPTLLFQRDHVPAVVVGDITHVVPHQHDAAAAGAFEEFFLGRVGNVIRIEAGALVFDFDVNGLFGEIAEDADFFFRIAAIRSANGTSSFCAGFAV